MEKNFEIIKNDNFSRVGKLRTKNGEINTPFFMPDATRASVRGLTNDQLINAGIFPMVVNTYHLYLQPGMELMKESQGVHAFMNWSGPLLSDSGGYQVYSLIHKNPLLGKITEDGAVFRSILNGSLHLLTPEKSIQVQFDMGVDMMVVLDDPRPNDASKKEVSDAVDRTVRWARRCKAEFEKQVKDRGMDENNRPLLFAVVQGGLFLDLREQCAKDLVEIGFDGYGFGGRHVDMEGVFMEEMIQKTASFIPEDAPRFALGVGTPEDIVRCHKVGWDMFDCVIPTREGRHGRLFVWNRNRKDKELIVDGEEEFYHSININNAKHKEDFTPIDPNCSCYACSHYTKAYLQHLFRVKEPLGFQMAALHNLKFYMELMERLRKS